MSGEQCSEHVTSGHMDFIRCTQRHMDLFYWIRLDMTIQSVNYEFVMHQRAAGNTQHLSGHCGGLTDEARHLGHS